MAKTQKAWLVMGAAVVAPFIFFWLSIFVFIGLEQAVDVPKDANGSYQVDNLSTSLKVFFALGTLLALLTFIAPPCLLVLGVVMLLWTHTPYRSPSVRWKDLLYTDALWHATVANALTLVGVTLLDWSILEVVVLYWAETLIIVFIQWLRLLVSKVWVGLVTLPFYGLFTMIWYVGVTFTIAILSSLDHQSDLHTGSFKGSFSDYLYALVHTLALPLALVMLMHLVDFIQNFIVNRKYASYLDSPIHWATWFLNVPSRFLVLVCTSAVGLVIGIVFRDTEGILYIFVLGKSVVDLIRLRHSTAHGKHLLAGTATP